MFEPCGDALILAALIGAFVFAGCGGDTSAPEASALSANATGGSAVGAGGASAGSATGGTAGAQLCLKTPAPSTHISDFTVWEEGNWGYQNGDLTGGQSLYQSDASATFTVSVDLSAPDPNLRLVAHDGTGAYSGYVMWFATCTDASKYLGIQFEVGGDLGGGALDFQVQTSTNYPIDGRNQKGECTGTWSTGCANNHHAVTVTPDLTRVQFTWAELTEGSTQEVDGGSRNSPMDPTNILGVQWQVNCPSSATCDMDFRIDTVEFIPP
jgi:hypothetical protein